MQPPMCEGHSSDRIGCRSELASMALASVGLIWLHGLARMCWRCCSLTPSQPASYHELLMWNWTISEAKVDIMLKNERWNVA